MKKYILATGLSLFCFFGASVCAQELRGRTMTENGSSPSASPNALVGPVASPTDNFEQFTFRQLVSASFTSPSTRRAGIVAIALFRLGFTENAIRAFLIEELRAA